MERRKGGNAEKVVKRETKRGGGGGGKGNSSIYRHLNPPWTADDWVLEVPENAGNYSIKQ